MVKGEIKKKQNYRGLTQYNQSTKKRIQIRKHQL